MMSKELLREHFKKVRKHLSETRRKEARDALWDYLEERLANFCKVLSFASMKDEIDLSLVNQILMKGGKLYLPKIEGDHLTAYHVKDLEKETYYMQHKILQPNPLICEKEDLFDCILVPAIAFDEHLNRLGYGFGYYDRLLSHCKDRLSIGVGFREQLSTEPLPTEAHDQPVRELCLV